MDILYLRIVQQEHEKVHVIPEGKLSQKGKGEDVHVSTQAKNFFYTMARLCYAEETIKINSASQNTKHT